MVRAAVIGLGPIGNLHARIYAEDELVELCGVCDIIEERAQKAGEALDVPWFTSAPDLLAELQPDLCSIATGGYEYSSDHYEPTLQAFEAGCHVLCEKPICNEVDKAARMVEAGASAGKLFGIDFNHRFTPAARAAEGWLRDGKVGSLLFCNMALWIGKPQDLESPWFHIKALNPHSIDMVRHFCGDITRVQCFAMKAPGRSLWSTASFNFELASGAVAHLTSSYDIGRGHPMERCEVAGTAGRFVLEDMWRQATLYPASGLMKEVYTNPVFGGFRDFNDTFRERIRCFVRQIEAGAHPDEVDGSGADGLAAQKVIQAAIASIESRSVLQVG